MGRIPRLEIKNMKSRKNSLISKSALFAMAMISQVTCFGTDFYTPAEDIDGLKATTDVQEYLPNVLIIGDSISIGYTPAVRKHFEGRANVFRPDANCGDTINGLRQIDKWLGQKKWDVIHFNWGLHDLCYRHPESKDPGRRDKVRGNQSVPLDKYKENLEKLVVRLKKTGAQLIWASTTVVPENELGRIAGDELKYNAVAAEIMERHGVTVNDLHALTANFPPEFFAGYGSGVGNVHFSRDQGSPRIGQQVSACVEAALTERLNK
jgi:hypothetical protein